MTTKYRSFATAEHDATTNILTIAKPAGVVDTDLLLFYGFFNGGAITWPAGWNEAPTSSNFHWAFRIAASEGASYDFTSSVSGRAIGAIIAYSKPGSTDKMNAPINLSGTPFTSADTSTSTTPLAIYGWFEANNNLTADVNTNQRVNMPNTGAAAYSLVVADEYLSSTAIPAREATGYVDGDTCLTLEITFGGVFAGAEGDAWAWVG